MNRYMLIDFESKQVACLNKVDTDFRENETYCGYVNCADYNDVVETIIDCLPSKLIDSSDLLYYDRMVDLIDNLIVKLWNEYNPSDLNRIIMGLIYNFEPYEIQPQYVDYLIEELQELKENK